MKLHSLTQRMNAGFTARTEIEHSKLGSPGVGGGSQGWESRGAEGGEAEHMNCLFTKENGHISQGWF